jgi:hypothetical protein
LRKFCDRFLGIQHFRGFLWGSIIRVYRFRAYIRVTEYRQKTRLRRRCDSSLRSVCWKIERYWVCPLIAAWEEFVRKLWKIC